MKARRKEIISSSYPRKVLPKPHNTYSPAISNPVTNHKNPINRLLPEGKDEAQQQQQQHHVFFLTEKRCNFLVRPSPLCNLITLHPNPIFSIVSCFPSSTYMSCHVMYECGTYISKYIHFPFIRGTRIHGIRIPTHPRLCGQQGPRFNGCLSYIQ